MKQLEELRRHIEDNCIFRADPEKVYSENLDPGKLHAKHPARTMTYQFFLRRLAFNPRYLSICSFFLGNKILRSLGGKRAKFQLAGLETGSVPFIIGLQESFKINHNMDVNAFTVRKERKPYGIFNQVEGKPNNRPVVAIDDLFQSGLSMHRCMTFCQDELKLPLASVCGAVVALHSKENAADFRFWPNELGVKPRWLFNKDDFIYTYDKSKYWIPIDSEL